MDLSERSIQLGPVNDIASGNWLKFGIVSSICTVRFSKHSSQFGQLGNKSSPLGQGLSVKHNLGQRE